MNVNQVIKRPILTEKTYEQMPLGVYTFAVDKKTNKVEVKKAVEFIFDVKVESVNIFNVAKKPKKLGRFQGFTTSYKKAIVKLAEGHSIQLFEDETIETNEEKATPKAVEEKKPSAAEEKAAAKIAEKLAKAEEK
ncbi:50S ribosomal protein L23 [Mycoplasma iguanae]|uniref:Large ribosomal subunit protein uL23 n=1 Tax=Mycoplasma iguanae TaxID=292461 RepID=A0ABY5RAZ2_9MOLU|nr:50S ribosomal protein L23 [Mycoplasma iguanae]UVD81780.1 50S ribosomal protein L23 [Mycoplasma iguanae]